MTDSTPTDGMPVVPFGKYKGQYVTEMKKDRSYVDWFVLQADLVERYPVIYNIIIGGSKAKPKRKKQDTPQHNAMQAKYLGADLRRRVGRKYVMSPEELSDHGYRGGEYQITVGPVEFETHGWDATWETYVNMVTPGYEPRRAGTGFMHHHFVRVYLELKPSISDDYPVVMRQVMDRRARQFPNGTSSFNKAFVVITNELKPSTVAPHEVRQILRSQNIDLRLSSEFETGEIAA